MYIIEKKYIYFKSSPKFLNNELLKSGGDICIGMNRSPLERKFIKDIFPLK